MNSISHVLSLVKRFVQSNSWFRKVIVVASDDKCEVCGDRPVFNNGMCYRCFNDRHPPPGHLPPPYPQ
jgi:hypothetical protein